MAEPSLFSHLSAGLEADVRDMNPWWRGETLADVPPVRRWAFRSVLDNLQRGATRATVLAGPQRVGSISRAVKTRASLRCRCLHCCC
jgi:hypothetical protein